MTAAVVALLLATAVVGAAAARIGGRTGSAVAVGSAGLLAAAAAVALAAPAATGVGLAAVRVAAVIAALAGGSALVTGAFALAGATGRDESTPPADPPDPGPDGPGVNGPDDEAVVEEPLRGGLAIGVLERAAIAVCILANFSAGLAVIVAAKGLARYPELRHPGAAEQFIIGTFVSVLWASACAGVAVALGR